MRECEQRLHFLGTLMLSKNKRGRKGCTDKLEFDEVSRQRAVIVYGKDETDSKTQCAISLTSFRASILDFSMYGRYFLS